ncbi:xylulokinase [Thermoflexales bacterium]|nr:xylulokinase [Thermoflexales bacterium]
MSYFLGIDVSTTGAKALIIDEQGNFIASHTTEYPLSTPQPLWSEQDPHAWWNGACESIQAALSKAQLAGEAISAVGLTGQMHGLVMLDKSDHVLRPAILWNDQRTGPQCEAITAKVGGLERLLALTGNQVLPGFTAPKIVWVRENEPDVYEQTTHILLPKDYVRLRLTGEYATEVSDASGMSLLDVEKRVWSKEMLSALEIPEAWLPTCTESDQVSGRISASAAKVTGLKIGTPVVGGGGDQAAQAVGSGIVQAGVISVTSGTSGVVFAHSDQYAAEPQGRLHAFCHAVPGKWHYMGVMLSAGGSFRWLRDAIGDVEKAAAQLLGVDPYELLTREAESAPVGSEGLLFLPYLTGERTPYPDPQARGAFVGLTLRHGKAHLVRSVLEGVSFGLRDSLELIKGLGVPITQVRASGGGARSAVWRQIQADVFGTELVLVNVTEGAAYGAALLAGVGGGAYRSVAEAVNATVKVTERTTPLAANVETYAKVYPAYRGLYPALKDTFHSL